MATKIYLIRHGHHALLGRVLCGRMAGVQLDELGCQQMAACAEAIVPRHLAAMQASPQQRALQSANILAWRSGLPVEIVSAVDEIDIGDWTGRTFDELKIDPSWRRWNQQRENSRPPRGESMSELQQRIVDHLESLKIEHPNATIAIVSHAEPIRVALMYYLGIPLKDFFRVTVDPASISTLLMDGRRVHVVRINQKVSA